MYKKTEMTELKKRTVCSFKIEVRVFKSFLKYIRAYGFNGNGTKEILIYDCILRFDIENSKMWSIVTDQQRNIVVQVKAEVKDILNPVNIPIDIKEMEYQLRIFKDNKEIVEVSYEIAKYRGGIISLNKNDIIFSTKRNDEISFDLITDLRYGDMVDIKNLKNIEKMKNNIYKEENGEIELFFGKKLMNSFVFHSKQLKELIINRYICSDEYLFEFQEKKLKITVTNYYSKNRMKSRKIYFNKYNIKKPFMIRFTHKLTHAVNNLFGYIKIYAEEDSPMLIKSLDSEEKGLSVVYLVTTF